MTFKTTYYTMPFEKQFRIVLLSDLHQREPDEVIAITRSLKPNLIVVAGDTFERYDKEDLTLYRPLSSRIIRCISKTLDFFLRYSKEHPPVSNAYRLIKGIAPIAPVYLGLGNHEKYLKAKDLKVLEQNHVHLLINASEYFDDLLIGSIPTEVDEVFLEQFKQVEGTKILICHHPEYYDRYHLESIDLVLSGHTHGGQIRLFNHGVFASGQGLWPKYSKGLYHHNLIVSGGLSNTVSCPRLFNPREVVVIDLRKG